MRKGQVISISFEVLFICDCLENKTLKHADA